ncbi:MAG: TIGR01841 family phasin [Alphaproteobacteria bacterium]|nr:TIGR01841 family phasin [Alphaproteobacteria bacterium]
MNVWRSLLIERLSEIIDHRRGEQNAAKAAAKPIEDAVAAGKQTIEQAVKASTENYEQAIAMSKEQVENASNAVFRGYDDFATMNKLGVEAFLKAGNIWAKGYEDLGKAYVSFAQESAERGTEVAKAVMKAKTLQDVIDVQTDFAKQRFDHMVAEGTKMSELSAKVATEAMQPLQKQFDSAVSKMVKPTAI